MIVTIITVDCFYQLGLNFVDVLCIAQGVIRFETTANSDINPIRCECFFAGVYKESGTLCGEYLGF